jgi:hypothetical protein
MEIIMQLKRDDFPTLIELAERHKRSNHFLGVLFETLNQSLEEGKIRNVEMKDAKRYASDLASDAWKLKVSDPFVVAGQYMSLPKDVLDLYDSINFAGIHSVSAIEKKLAKSTIDHPCVAAMKQWLVEMKPLNHAIESLKPHVVMGRAPSTGPAIPVNPNKDVKTCPCCFRAIAVGSGKMVHHGYKRPGHGEQTRSCPGIRFQPLELSPDGLHYMLQAHKNSKEAAETLLAKKDEIKYFVHTTFKREEIKVYPGEPKFDQEMKGFIYGQERDIRYHTRDIEMFEERIANWKPDMKHKQVEVEDEGLTP